MPALPCWHHWFVGLLRLKCIYSTPTATSSHTFFRRVKSFCFFFSAFFFSFVHPHLSVHKSSFPSLLFFLFTLFFSFFSFLSYFFSCFLLPPSLSLSLPSPSCNFPNISSFIYNKDLTNTGSARCTECPSGTYVPPSSVGPCSQFLCSPGTYDNDVNPSTPCVSCNYMNSYQPNSGQSTCLPVSQCGPGYQEAAAPTLFTNRVCTACFQGINFKALNGSEVGCTPVTQCTQSQYLIQAPTISSDRICSNLTVCSQNQYETVAATYTSDRDCAALTVCNSSQYQTQAPTITSDRACASISICNTAQFQTAASTKTSDRVCQALTVCTGAFFQVVAPTLTSDRVCNQSYPMNTYFNGDFTALAGTPSLSASFQQAFNQSIISAGLPANAVVSITLSSGSIIAVAFMRQWNWRFTMFKTISLGNFSVMNATAFLCPLSHYLVSVDSQANVMCAPITACPINYFQIAPATFASNNICQLLSICPTGQLSPPTATSDRICNPATPIIAASTSGSSTGSLSPTILAVIIVLLVVVAILVLGVLYVHNKRRRDRKARDNIIDHMNSVRNTDMMSTMRDGNTLLGQLNRESPGAMLFSNPIFHKDGLSNGYLDVAPDWMAGQLTREQAEIALGTRPIGGFLIRQSASGGGYVLSIKVYIFVCVCVCV